MGLLVLRLSLVLPRGPVNFLGRLVGRAYFSANRKRREITLINLRLAFPELSKPERRQLALRHFEVAVNSMLDLPVLWWASDAYVSKFVSIQGIEHYAKTLAAGRNVVLLTGHFVGLDFGGAIISREFPHIGLIKPERNRLIDYFMERGRTRFGATLYLRDKGMRPVIRAIRSGHGFYYLPDEDHGPEKSVFVDFFATKAAMLTGAAKLIASCDAVALPAYVRRLDKSVDGKHGYELVIHAPIENFPVGDAQLDAQTAATSLEQNIRKFPEQYMWTFRIFHSRPNNEKSPYFRPRDVRRAGLENIQPESDS